MLGKCYRRPDSCSFQLPDGSSFAYFLHPSRSQGLLEPTCLPACRRQVNIKLWIARPGMNVYYFYWEHAVLYPVPIDQKPVVHLLGWGGMLCSSYMASLFRTQKIASKRRHKRADGSNLFSSCVHGAEMKRKSQFLRWHFCVPSVVVGRNTAKLCSALPNVYFVLLFAFGLILFWTYYRYCSEAMQCVEVGA